MPREDLIQALWDTEEFIDENTLTVKCCQASAEIETDRSGRTDLYQKRCGVSDHGTVKVRSVLERIFYIYERTV